MSNKAEKKLSWRQRLKALDERNAALWRRVKRGLNRLDQRSGRACCKGKTKLDHLDTLVLDGASKGLVKKRTGYPWLDKLSAWLYEFCRLLDKVDTWIFFPGRPYQAKACRVRSKSERQIANWLTDHGLRFKYEKPLRLGKVTLHPDFFLTDYGVYVEYWGLADSDSEYDQVRQTKLRLYRRHGICVVSLYPRHLGHLDTEFPRLFLEVTSRELP